MRKNIFLLTALVPFTVACADSTGPQATTPVGVRFGVAQPQASASASPSSSSALFSTASNDGVTVANGENTLVISEVKMTLADIDLEAMDESPNIEGPVLVRLNLTGDGLTSPIQAQVEPGSYSVISFDIAVPDGGDPAEVRYLEQNPDMEGVSMRVSGTYNGQPFSFALDLWGDQELALSPPLVVTEGQSGLEVVIQFDVASWFVRADGTLMDPSAICSEDAGCADRTTVEQNIERTIQSYSDN